jgi:hypothetical protein
VICQCDGSAILKCPSDENANITFDGNTTRGTYLESAANTVRYLSAFRRDPVAGPLFGALRAGDQIAGRGAIVEIEAKGFRIDLSRAQWFTSTRGGPASDNCVEVAFVDEAIAVRDSNNPQGPALIFTAAEWDAFVGGARDGEFDR